MSDVLKEFGVFPLDEPDDGRYRLFKAPVEHGYRYLADCYADALADVVPQEIDHLEEWPVKVQPDGHVTFSVGRQALLGTEVLLCAWPEGEAGVPETSIISYDAVMTRRVYYTDFQVEKYARTTKGLSSLKLPRYDHRSERGGRPRGFSYIDEGQSRTFSVGAGDYVAHLGFPEILRPRGEFGALLSLVSDIRDNPQFGKRLPAAQIDRIKAGFQGLALTPKEQAHQEEVFPGGVAVAESELEPDVRADVLRATELALLKAYPEGKRTRVGAVLVDGSGTRYEGANLKYGSEVSHAERRALDNFLWENGHRDGRGIQRIVLALWDADAALNYSPSKTRFSPCGPCLQAICDLVDADLPQDDVEVYLATAYEGKVIQTTSGALLPHAYRIAPRPSSRYQVDRQQRGVW